MARTIAGETILVPVTSQIGNLDAIYNLNPVAGLIWTMVDRQAGFREIVDAVCREFDVSADVAAEDTAQFISVLEKAGMVQSEGA